MVLTVNDLQRDLPPRWPSNRDSDFLSRSTRSLGQMSMLSTSFNTKSPLARSSRVSRTIWKGRISFVVLLGVIGLSFASMAFFIMREAEEDLGELQYTAIAERASIMALKILNRKRLGLVTLSSMISGANPDVGIWPQICVSNYEVIANNLMQISDDLHMGFAPFVTPQQVQSFEKHSYDFYEGNRSPEPFPEGTAISPFGKGIYAVDPLTMLRYHDTTGETTWNSSNRILAPILHHSRGPESCLLSNLHANEAIGPMIDGMIECAKSKKNSFDGSNSSSLDDCTMLSSFSPNTVGWNPYDCEESWASLIHPVYAQRSPEKLTGVVFTSLLWDQIFSRAFDISVTGLHAVLKSSDGSSYTYIIQEGQATLLGKGDLHYPEYDIYQHELDLTSTDSDQHYYFGQPSVGYKLYLYPTEDFFALFQTANPMLSSIGVIAILLVTSTLFTLYDVVVKRDYYVKRDLLEAKRKFIRFVSHEVRTPLNSVSMGLTVLRGELEAKYGNSDETCTIDTWATTKSSGKTDKELVAMSDEIAMNCNSAVDVMNDFMNFDKIETDNLALDLSFVRLFDQVETTAKEFKMVAENSNIKLAIDTPLIADKKPRLGKECFTVGDSLRITHVLRNLIANAFECTPDHGEVMIKAAWISTSMKNPINSRSFILKDGKKIKVNCNGLMKFTVADTGKGMTQAQIRKIMHRDIKFNVNKLQAGNGSGIGLWVAKGIVMRHGGTFTVKSDGLGRGTTFTVSLPTYDILDPRAKAEISGSSEGVKDGLGILKVLVVDDAKMNLKLLMRLVSKKGHKVDGAEDGEIAVEKASRAMEAHADYDVILMDYQMPNMDGPTATRILRNNGCNAFICGVTGNVMAEDVKYFKDCGANEVIPKPAKIKALEDLWIEYGLRGESPTKEGAYDGIIESKPKVEAKQDFNGEMSVLSLSSFELESKIFREST